MRGAGGKSVRHEEEREARRQGWSLRRKERSQEVGGTPGGWDWPEQEPQRDCPVSRALHGQVGPQASCDAPEPHCLRL